jgi:hypothetical protein
VDPLKLPKRANYLHRDNVHGALRCFDPRVSIQYEKGINLAHIDGSEVSFGRAESIETLAMSPPQGGRRGEDFITLAIRMV